MVVSPNSVSPSSVNWFDTLDPQDSWLQPGDAPPDASDRPDAGLDRPEPDFTPLDLFGDGPGLSNVDAFDFKPGASWRPAGPESDGPSDAGPSDFLSSGAVTRWDAYFSAKPTGDEKPGGGGGGGNGGGKGGSDPAPEEPGVLSSYTSSAEGSDYNIEVIFQGSWTSALQQAFITSADFISSLILGDVTDILRGRYATDDITITAELTAIDGPGGILGQAGPTAYRSASLLPVAGIMQFDTADANVYEGIGLWDDIIFHEMMHCVGFGTMWDLMGLTSGSIADGSLAFEGALATSYYNDEFSGISGGSASNIPIESDGEAGTAGGHWDEGLFDNEIMTGYIDSSNYLSLMSIAALEDMGYDTVLDDPNDTTDLSALVPPDILSDTVLT